MTAHAVTTGAGFGGPVTTGASFGGPVTTGAGFGGPVPARAAATDPMLIPPLSMPPRSEVDHEVVALLYRFTGAVTS